MHILSNLGPWKTVKKPFSNGKLLFASWFCLLGASAFLAGSMPIWFALNIVIIFGAPHNWIEFRYFLWRLPSRFGPFKVFFLTAFTGAIVLATVQSTIIVLYHTKLLSPSLTRTILTIWNECLILWILTLFHLRYKAISRAATTLSLALSLVLSIANACSPFTFTALLTYIHPLIGICILERELRRTQKTWLSPFHKCLAGIPIVILVLLINLNNNNSDSSVYADTLSKLSGNDAYRLLQGISAKALLASYAFLQMIHYGIWIFMIPIATQGWKRWPLDRIPALTKRNALRPLLGIIVTMGALLMISFWIGFRLDHDATIKVYVVLTTLHVLAEVPFLFWMFES